MAKFLALVSAIFVLALFVLFSESNQEDHSLFYIHGDNVYETMKQDSSFGTAPAFFIIEQIPKIKKRIATGEYEIRKGETALSVISKMLSGRRVIRKLTIPEGYTVKMILEIIRNNKLLFGEISENISEASLAPNTYFYYFGDSKVSMIQKMKNQMNKMKNRLADQNKTKFTFDEILVLASIIEKESGKEDERNLISSVFHNRLRIKMRLQSDPTVIYALTNGYGKMDRKLTRQDLWFKSPYNTYRNAGLPPTPICCPSERSILAAMQPTATNYLYFVADKDSTRHVFSKDYKSHLNTVRRLKSAN